MALSEEVSSHANAYLMRGRDGVSGRTENVALQALEGHLVGTLVGEYTTERKPQE